MFSMHKMTQKIIINSYCLMSRMILRRGSACAVVMICSFGNLSIWYLHAHLKRGEPDFDFVFAKLDYLQICSATHIQTLYYTFE